MNSKVFLLFLAAVPSVLSIECFECGVGIPNGKECPAEWNEEGITKKECSDGEWCLK